VIVIRISPSDNSKELYLHHNFHNYVHLIYPDGLKIKDTIEFDMSASYLDIILNIDWNDRLTITLYYDDFNFAMVNFPILCSTCKCKISLSPAYKWCLYFPVDSICKSKLRIWWLFKARPTMNKKVGVAGL
jgi:hypothetical protein